MAEPKTRTRIPRGLADEHSCLEAGATSAASCQPPESIVGLPSLCAAPPEINAVEEAVADARRTLRALSADLWPVALPLCIGALDRSRAFTDRGLSLDGRTDVDLFSDALRSSLDPEDACFDFTSHTDAEIFLGFCGAQASRSKVARWEIAGRGVALVDEALHRIRRAAPEDDPATEGIHWSLALIYRVQREEVEPEYLSLAIRLLQSSAGQHASPVLRSYLEKQNGNSLWLLDRDELRGTLTARDLEPLQASRPSHALDAPRLEPKIPPRAFTSRAPRSLLLLVTIAAAALISVLLFRAAQGPAGPAPLSASGPLVTAPLESSRDEAAENNNVISAQLAAARVDADQGNWARVVEGLADRPGSSFPEGFQWDSLLAVGAFRQAGSLDQSSATRARLLRLVYEGSTRIIENGTPFEPSSDHFRLLRAEACISGGLNCGEELIRRDLVLAARSSSRLISDRAMVLLADVNQ